MLKYNMLFNGKFSYLWKNVSFFLKLSYKFDVILVIILMFDLEFNKMILELLGEKCLRLIKIKKINICMDRN